MNWVLLQNSLLLATGTTLLCLLLGMAGAVALLTCRPTARRIWLGASVLGMALPPFLVTNCWMDLADPLGLGLDHEGLFSLYSLPGAVLVLAGLTWPVTLLFVWSAWQRLDPSHLEQDSVLTGWALIRWVLWPVGRGSMMFAAVITGVLVLNHFAVPALLQVKVLPAMLWVQFNTTFSYGEALRTAWPLVLAPLTLLLVLRDRAISWPRLSGPLSAVLFRNRLGTAWGWAARAVLSVTLLLSAGVPLGHLLCNTRTWSQLMPALEASMRPALHTFLLAAGTATVCVALGVATWKVRALRLLWLPFLVPGVALGILLILLFNRPWLDALYRGSGVVILAWTIRYAAPAWQGMRQAFQHMDRDLTDAARASGASNWALLRHVQWPHLTRTVEGTWYLTYLLCLWDVETLVLITPPGGETLALRVFNLLHYGHNDQVNALCLILVALAILPGVLVIAGSAVRRLVGAALPRNRR